MDKMYRIFLSSTQRDLTHERKAIQKAILRMNHYPICMETFPASHRFQIDFITEQLNSADIYIIILAKKYGTVIPNQDISYTEFEYEYAKQIGLPIFTFICSDVYQPLFESRQTEPEYKYKWEKFREKLNSEQFRVSWENTEELIGAVLSSLDYHLNEDFGGWIREQKYFKIIRQKIDTEINKIQDEFNEISNVKFNSFLDYNCFVSVSNRLKRLIQNIETIGFVSKDSLRFKKIDFIYFHIRTLTEEHNLNPKPIYDYAKFLFKFYDIARAKQINKEYLARCKHKKEKIRANNFMGLLYWKILEFELAQKYLNKAIKGFFTSSNNDIDDLYESIHKKLKRNNYEIIFEDLILIGEIYNNFGLINDNLGHYDTALKYYYNASKTIEILFNYNKEKFLYKYQLYLFNYSSVLYKIGNYVDAFTQIKNVINLLQNLPDALNKTMRLARSHQLYANIIARINAKEDEIAAQNSFALHFYNEAIKLQKEYLKVSIDRFKPDLAWCYYRQSQIYYSCGQFINAINSLEQAINYQEELLLHNNIAEHNNLIKNLAESYSFISRILFEYSNKEINSQYINDAFRYAEDSFFYYEFLYTKHPKIYRKEYIEISQLNLDICITKKMDLRAKHFEEIIQQFEAA